MLDVEEKVSDTDEGEVEVKELKVEDFHHVATKTKKTQKRKKRTRLYGGGVQKTST